MSCHFSFSFPFLCLSCLNSGNLREVLAWGGLSRGLDAAEAVAALLFHLGRSCQSPWADLSGPSWESPSPRPCGGLLEAANSLLGLAHLLFAFLKPFLPPTPIWVGYHLLAILCCPEEYLSEPFVVTCVSRVHTGERCMV